MTLENPRVLEAYMSGTREQTKYGKKKKRSWDFPVGPGVKTLHIHCRGHGSDPWSWK